MRLADAPQWLVSAFVRSVIAVGATADRQRIQRTAWTLVARWQEPERTFHNLRHLTDVLARVDELAEETHVPDVVRLAAWYHGAVFNASAPVAYARRGGEDAVASADLARTELAALGVPATVTARIHELVTTLDRHDADEHDVDALALCDADLATLAVEPQRYAAYRRAIRAEYAHIPESDYVASRIAILTRLLQRRRLFVSPFSHAWKEPARENLTAELSHLRARLAELGGTELPAGDQPRPHAGAATSWPGHGPTARGAAREAPVTATGGSPAAADMRRLSPPPPSGTARAPWEHLPRSAGATGFHRIPSWRRLGHLDERPRRCRRADRTHVRRRRAVALRHRAGAGVRWAPTRPGQAAPGPRCRTARGRGGGVPKRAVPSAPAAAALLASGPALRTGRSRRREWAMRFEVDSTEVEAAAARARASAGVIHVEVAGMMTQLLDLQSTWSGAAAQSFAAVAQEWRATQQVVEQSLAQITEALDLAGRTYAEAESSAHGLFTR